MVQEARTIAEIRKKLIDKYVDAAPEDRLHIRRDIDETGKELRRLGIYQKAVNHLSQSKEKAAQPEDSTNVGDADIALPWMDRFNEFARTHNEPWRQELLSRALAMEASQAGAIGPRALWLIGTLDEPLFHAFAAILDVSSNIGGNYLVPSFASFAERPIPTCALGTHLHLGNLLFMVSELSLVGDTLTSQTVVPANSVFLAIYDHRRVQAKTKSEMRISGVILTPLGLTISRLYEPKANPLGQEIFDTWLNSVRGGMIEVLNEI